MCGITGILGASTDEIWYGSFIGGFLGNTINQLISYDDFYPKIAYINAVISWITNMTLYYGASKLLFPGYMSFIEAILPSLGVFAMESFIRQYTPNSNKLRMMKSQMGYNDHSNYIYIEYLWRWINEKEKISSI